jgi:hypothetical protein
MTHENPLHPSNSTRVERKSHGKLILFLLLLLLGLSILFYLFINQPTPEAPVVAKPAPVVNEETEQEKWVKNLDALTATPLPSLTCNQLFVEQKEIELGNGEKATIPIEVFAPDGEVSFINLPDEPTSAQLFPDKSSGRFERCAVNIAVPYVEQTVDGVITMAPDRSSVEAIVGEYGYMEATEGDIYSTDGVIRASSNLYETSDTMADAVRREAENSSSFVDGITVVTKPNSVVVDYGEVLSIAFSTNEDLGNAPQEALDELRSKVSNEQYKVLNDYADTVLVK